MSLREFNGNLSVIATPLADKKLEKKILRVTKKAAKQKGVRRGVKEVVKSIRRGEAGICILAGDISPIDVITHIPLICENAGITYCYVSSKEALGTASLTKRPTSVVLISTVSNDDSLYEKYQYCLDSVKSL